MINNLDTTFPGIKARLVDGDRINPAIAVAVDGEVAAAVRTELTPALVREGLARELVRRIQTMRAAADFNVDDRIATGFETDSEELRQVFTEYGDYVRAETLSIEIRGRINSSHSFGERSIQRKKISTM